jgi:hypothetical protein
MLPWLFIIFLIESYPFLCFVFFVSLCHFSMSLGKCLSSVRGLHIVGPLRPLTLSRLAADVCTTITVLRDVKPNKLTILLLLYNNSAFTFECDSFLRIAVASGAIAVLFTAHFDAFLYLRSFNCFAGWAHAKLSVLYSVCRAMYVTYRTNLLFCSAACASIDEACTGQCGCNSGRLWSDKTEIKQGLVLVSRPHSGY